MLVTYWSVDFTLLLEFLLFFLVDFRRTKSGSEFGHRGWHEVSLALVLTG